MYFRATAREARNSSAEYPSLESLLRAALADVGPFIALDPVTEWPKAVVEAWLDKAKLVLIAGSPENLAWRLQACLKRLRPEQLVVVMPFAQAWQYADFRDAANECLPHALPKQMGPSGLIAFHAGFEPYFLPERSTSLQRWNRQGRLHVLLRQNLHPILDALGVFTGPIGAFSTTSKRVVIAACLVFGIVYASIVWGLY